MSIDTTDQVSDQDQSSVSDGDAGNESNDAKFKKLLGQRKADQEKLKELQSKLGTFESEKRKLEEEKMKHEGNFKALLDSREKELQELSSKLKDYESKVVSYEETFINQKKINAFHQAIGGKLKDQEYYDLFKADKIALDDEGNIDEKSLKQYASEFINKHKSLIDFKTGKMPDGAAKVTGSKDQTAIESMTPAQLEQLIKDRAAKGLL